MKISTTRTMSRSIPDRQRRRFVLTTATLLLATACSPQQPSGQVDIGNAAQAAHESVGAYASGSSSSGPTAASTAPASARPAPLASPSASASAPVAGATEKVAEPGAAEAAAVVRRYLALIADRDFATARSLWDRGGAASGMSEADFAASFARYRSFKGEVGEPGRIDAGAGQRYITVPVRVTGTLKNGDPFTLAGPITLHRTGPVDGATEQQRQWHISASALKPRPGAAAPAMPDQVTARFRCRDGLAFTAVFDNAAGTVALALPGAKVQIPAQRAASGIWYEGSGYELRGKGRDATLTEPSGKQHACRDLDD